MMHILNEITSLMSPLAMIPDLIPVLGNPNERFYVFKCNIYKIKDQIPYIVGNEYILSFLCDYNGL